MKNYCNDLYRELKNQVQQIQHQYLIPVREAEAIYEAVNAVMLQLKEFILTHTFTDVEEEMDFFKHIKPRFEAEQVYYGELYYIRAKLPIKEEGVVQEYIKQLEFIQAYFHRHQFLYNYYRLGEESLDKSLFVRNAEKIPFIPDKPIVHRDARFATLGSYRFAKFMAFEHLQDYLNKEIKKIKHPPISVNDPKLKWTASKVALVELTYALKASNVFNHGKVSISDIAVYLEEMFQKDLSQYYRTFQEIRIRKSGRTTFIDALKLHLEKWMDNTDLNGKGEDS
ncbi:RteC domain-containing protein [Echinicola sp. 20G]|uniref:RteC domain-containing protein n=1 Tax=Echinicola sp. 20G TaxID=2781961 RepID=UPI001910894E|nr:RteC domain-containing protein [Echinicola sp. 20G]